MNEVKNAVNAMNEINTTVTNIVPTAYVKPAIEVIEMEMEGAILYESSSATGSDIGNGGVWGEQ